MPRRVIAQPLPMDLRNWSFRGLNCEGWNFQGRDLRGCDFRNANLSSTNFSKTVNGRSRKQNVRDVVIVLFRSAMAAFAFFVAFSSVFMTAAFSANQPDIEKGYALATAFLMAGVLIFLGAVILVSVGTVIRADVFAGASLGTSTVTGLRSVEASLGGQILAGISFGVVTIFCLVLSLDRIRESIRELKNATGTNFKSAILENADFSSAKLDNCNFDEADTSYVNWNQVEGRRSTIDFTDFQMQLLISRQGRSSTYLDLDLSNQDLVGVQLIKANLNGTDLTRSNLQNADLTFANLTNLKAGGTNFSHATLTGACIRNWAINNNTKFNGLICDYIYISPDLEDQDRRPLSGSFEPGDFELLVDRFADTLDFILRRGTDPVVFKQALRQFQQNNPTARIKAMVDLDADRVLVQATVPEGADKVKMYESFQVTIQLQAQKIGYLEATVDDKTRTIDLLINKPAPPAPTIQILQATHTTGDLMSDKSTQTQAGGDIISAGDGNQGVVGKNQQGVAGRDISGTLNLNLAALGETADPKAKELVDLITQVRDAIDAADSELDDRHKIRALEYLDNLTKLAKDKPEKLLKTAKDNLDDLADIADKGSKIATFAEKYLPTFTAAIVGLRLWFGI
jgi:uncharacterized protein YjbI with pentapeptide repeats